MDNPTLEQQQNINVFYQGGVGDAINYSKQKGMMFVVVVYNPTDNKSTQLIELLGQDQDVVKLVSQTCVLLKIDHNSEESKQLKQFYTYENIPCILFIGLNGTLHQKIEDSITKNELIDSINSNVKKHQQQLLSMYFQSLSPPQQQSSQSIPPPPTTNIQQPPLQEQQPPPVVKIPQQPPIKLNKSSIPNKATETVPKTPTANLTKKSNPTTNPTTTNKPISPPTKTVILPASPPPPPTSTTIVCKLTNGFSIKETFKPNQHLIDVKRFVDSNRNDGKHSYYMMTTFPKRIFYDSDMDSTLLDLDLVPSATLIMTSTDPSIKPKPAPVAETPSVVPTSTSGGHTFGAKTTSNYQSGGGFASDTKEEESHGGYFSSVKSSISKFFNPFWHPTPESSSSSSTTTSSGNIHSLQPTSYKTMKKDKKDDQEKSSLKKRGKGKNVHQLGHQDDEEDDGKNNYYNGNSTQFK